MRKNFSHIEIQRNVTRGLVYRFICFCLETEKKKWEREHFICVCVLSLLFYMSQKFSLLLFYIYQNRTMECFLRKATETVLETFVLANI